MRIAFAGSARSGKKRYPPMQVPKTLSTVRVTQDPVLKQVDITQKGDSDAHLFMQALYPQGQKRGYSAKLLEGVLVLFWVDLGKRCPPILLVRHSHPNFKDTLLSMVEDMPNTSHFNRDEGTLWFLENRVPVVIFQGHPHVLRTQSFWQERVKSLFPSEWPE